ncbi:MAG: DEAD/DEAH box helicase [Pseudomonadota bacterium]
MRPLRDYQQQAIAQLRLSIRSGKKRPMLQLPTGGGKTLLSAHIIAGARSKGKRVCFVVPALSLIDQTVTAFFDEKLSDIGVIQADHPMTDGSKPIQVASIQTISRREFPETDIVIVDEAHKAFKAIFQWMKDRPDVLFIGLSATPWARGLGKYYDDLIIGTTTRQLIEDGYLSRFRAFAPTHPDLSDVKTVAGDYHEGQLAAAMNQPHITADVVETWLKLGENRPTLCFGVDRAHAQSLQEAFEKAGMSAAYMDAFTDRHERSRVQRAFASGNVKVVCNVGVLTTGVDWDVRCLILARPTKSEMLFTQIVGRGLRMAEGKQDCLVLDHTDTTSRLGFVTDIHRHTLDDGQPLAKKRKQVEAAKLPKECPSCCFLKPAKVHKCSNCGFAPKLESNVVAIDGELAELSTKHQAKNNQATSWPMKENFIGQLRFIAQEKGRSEGWVAHSYKDKFGVWPNDERVKHAPMTLGASREVRNWVLAKDIRFAKSRQNDGGAHVSSA